MTSGNSRSVEVSHDRLTVLAPFHSLFYAPQFVATELGHFAREGLDVTTHTAAGGADLARALLDGAADIGLGGLMRSLVLADRGGGILVHFAEVNSRNGFFLLSREPRPRFHWPDLMGKTVISFAEAPTPWQCMLTVLRRHGVDAARVNFVRDLATPEAVAAFRAGHGDFLEQGQPVVEQLLAGGAAHLAASMGEATGPLPFSSYMVRPELLREKSGVLLRFTRALYRAQRWIATSDAAAMTRVIAPAFPQIDGHIRALAVERYLQQGTWARDPILRRPGFDYLQEILLSGGLIQHGHRYEDLVDTEIARCVVDGHGAQPS